MADKSKASSKSTNSSRFKDALNVMKQARTSQTTARTAPRAASSEKPTRPGGKKNDPNYTQCNGYIPRDLYKRVRLALVEDEMELGALMEKLLNAWLSKRKQ